MTKKARVLMDNPFPLFRTVVPVDAPLAPTSRSERLLLAGSCFAETIGCKLLEHKFTALVNPFGATFNPVSLADSLRNASFCAPIDEKGYLERDGAHFHFDYHSSLFGTSKNELFGKIRTIQAETGRWLQRTDRLFLTLGTAFVYERADTGQIVNNCHKLPSKKFHKRLLSVEEVESAIRMLADSLPHLKSLTLTVSPVRHAKDGFPENAVSKSVLRLACHRLSEDSRRIDYFPAYEILLDELRDYRFYADDLLHPSPQAEAYIWQRFASAWLDKDAQAFVSRWAKTRQKLTHRPLLPGSAAHRAFLENLREELLAYAREEVDVQDELQRVKSRLSQL